MKPHLLLILPLLLASLACGIELTTPTPTQMVSISPSPVLASPTIKPPEPTATLAPSRRYFVNDFNVETTDWSTIVTSGEPGLLDLRVEKGFWVFDLGGRNLNAIAIYQPESYKNVRIDFSVTNRGDSANSLSVICRYNEKEGWYQYEIFNSGLYNLYYVVWDKDKHPSPTLLAHGGSNAIRAGRDFNEFGVVCDERDIKLYVNNQFTKSYTDNQFVLRDGQIGIGVSSFNRLPILLDFDWLKVSLP